MSPIEGGTVNRGVLPKRTSYFTILAVLVLLINAGIAYRSIARMIENDGLVTHTTVVLANLEQLISSLKDAETGGRGFIITGDDSFLEPYNIAIGKIAPQIARLKQLTSDNLVQQRRFPELESLVDRKLTQVKLGIELRRTDGFAGAQRFISTGAGKTEMDALRVVISSMQDDEHRLLNERMKASAASSRRTILSFGLATFLAITFLIIIFRTLRREQQLRTEADEIASQLRAMYQHAAVGFKQVAPDGRLLMVNPALCRMLGYRESELLQKTFTDITHPDDRLREAALQGSLLRGDRDFYSLEKRCQRSDGSSLWVHVTTSAVKDSDEQYLYGITVLQDIDERKQAEQALRESEERFRELAEGIPQLAWMADPEGWIYWYNQRWYQYTGTSPKQMEGWGWQSVHDPVELPKVLERWKASIATGESFEMVFPLLGDDGVFRPFLTRVVPLRDSQGRVVRWFGTNTDISAQKHAEEALRDQAALLDLAHDTIMMRGLDGTISFWNQGAEGMYGYSKQEALGRISHVILCTVFPRPLPEIEAALLREGRWEGELMHTTHDGSRIVVASRWVLQRDKNGQPSGVMEINNDITARVQAEQQLRELNQQLEDRVRRRTAELETANKELEAFSYSVSHDLRGPLRTMDGFSQALMEDHASSLNEKGQHYLNRIRTAAQKMGQLIDDMLQLSRLTRAEMRVRPIDLSEMATKLIEELRASEPGRQVDVHIEPGLEVTADPGLLQVALYNLFTNAWKFTSRRERALIEFGQVSNGLRTAFFVRDNGAGFDMRYADHLFSPFQRLHAEEDFKGTGIGLATVHRIIRRHDGRIWAEAAEGQGATFYFELGSESAQQRIN